MERKNNLLKGFTLIELIIYVAILTVILAAILSIFTGVIRVGNQETSSSEVTSQLTFLSQAIERFVRDSSNIEIPVGVATGTLKLRMASSTIDPTCIIFSGGAVLLAQGQGAGPGSCSAATTIINNNKVVVDNLTFTKQTSYPGHDSVTFTLQLTASTTNAQNRASRSLTSAIARVSAATFDSSLLPGSSGTYNLGQAGSYWNQIIMGDGTAAAPSYTFSNNIDLGLFRAGNNILGFSTGGVQRMAINGSGNVGIGTASPNSKLQISGGDVYINNSNYGIILTAPNGSCWRVRASSTGALTQTSVSCP